MLRCFTLCCVLILQSLCLAAETRDLLLVAGQSNAVGFDANEAELPVDPRDAETQFWWRVGDPPPDTFDGTSGRQWTHLQSQTRTPAMEGEAAKQTGRQYGNFNKSMQGGFGPEMGLVRTLQAKQNRPLAVIKTAFSGTSVAGDWNVGRPGQVDACYRAMIEEIRLAREAAKTRGVTLRPRALVWVQGESDAHPQHAPVYAANLSAMLQRLRTDLQAPDLILLLGVNTRFGNGKNPHMPAVIAAQQQVAQELARCRYVDTAGAETLPPSHTHFTAAGTLEIGRRFAEALLTVEATAASGEKR